VFEFLGRLDDQIQIRGLRVETGEIVGVANRHPTVQACAVTPVTDADGTQLVLFIVARPAKRLDEERLRAYLGERLPEQMVPTHIVGLPAMPTTANGKIDHAALADIATSQIRAASHSPTGPASDVEAAIAETVAELLKRRRVRTDENFFLLGGHSMLGAQLIVRIAKVYGVEIPLLTLFDHPTVAELAHEVERLVLDEICGMSDDELLHATAQLSAESRAQS
jgi:acyl carrier protein